MHHDAVQALGNMVYGAGISPYLSSPLQRAVIFGLDTEWYQDENSGHNKFLCWQLSLNESTSQIFLSDLSWETLYDESVNMLKANGYRLTDVASMFYAVFLSTAEAQWLLGSGLPDKNTRIQQFGTHQLHIRHQARANRSMTLFDLSNWTTGNKSKNLDSMADTFMLNKLKYDVSSLSPESLEDQKFVDYAVNDGFITGEILRKLRQKILDDCGIDILKTKTPASTAAADFRQKNIPRVIIGYRKVYKKLKSGEIREYNRKVYKQVRQSNCTVRRWALRASHGGRKEVFYQGSLPNCYEYDAVSAYPSAAMLMEILPLEKDIRETQDLDEFLRAKGGWGCFIFEFPEGTTHPCLPVMLKGKGIIYPLKGFSHCTIWQVRLAMEMGASIKLYRAFYYNDGVNWLAEYEKSLTDKRYETNDAVMRDIYKLMANSLIGKLTQKRMEYDLNDLIRASREHGVPVEVLKTIVNADELGIKKRLKTGPCFMPEWNMLILGWYQANVSSLAAKCNAVQIATDAVFTTEYMGERFEHRGILYKLEQHGKYIAIRPGLYKIDRKVKHHSATRNIADELFDAFLRGDEYVEYDRKYITSIKQALNNDKFNLGETYWVPYRVNLCYDGKRILYEDGTTVPWESVYVMPYYQEHYAVKD